MLFLTDTGTRVPAVTSEQMREIDRIAMHELGPNLYQMMENAGRALASRVLTRLACNRTTSIVLVLAGRGGNGGGGICAARHLSNHGVRTRLCLSEPNRLGEVPAWQLQIFQSTSGEFVDARRVEWSDYAFVVDALIGYGLQGSPRGVAAELIDAANASTRPIIALDVPSGIDATTDASEQTINADETVTLALPKTGLVSPRAGALFLADLGIPAKVYQRLNLSYATPFDERSLVPIRLASA